MNMTVQKARKILGKRYSKYNDDEISSLISQLEIFAEIYIDVFDKDDSKKQLGVLDSSLKISKNETRN